MSARPIGHGVLLLSLLALAFGVRLLAARWMDSRLPQGVVGAFGDTDGYLRLAKALARGADYQVDAGMTAVFRTPGYPMMIAGPLRLTPLDASQVALGVSLACGTATVAAVYWLARALFDPTTALLAAALASAYPGAIVLSVFLLSEAPFCPLFVVQLAAHARSWRATRTNGFVAWSIAAGALAGAATLMRPSWLLFIPFATGCGVLVGPPRGRQLLAGGCALVALCLVMSPWWIRNYRLTGRFIPTTLQVGPSLYDGLGPQATGGSDMSFMRHVDDAFWERFNIELRQDPADLPVKVGLEKAEKRQIEMEYERDRELREQSLAWARANPGRVAQLAAIKFVRMWNVWPNEPQFRSWPVRLGVFLTYVPIMVLALVGAWRFSRRGWPYVLCWLPAVYLTLLHMIFVSSIRYREPAMLPLIVLAAGVIVDWLRSRHPGVGQLAPRS